MGDIFKGDFQEEIDAIGEFNIFDENGLIEENRGGRFSFYKENGVLECFFSSVNFKKPHIITKITGRLKTGDYIYIEKPLTLKTESNGFLKLNFTSFYASNTPFVCENIEEVLIEEASFPVKGLLTFTRGLRKKDGVFFKTEIASEGISLNIILNETETLSGRDKIIELQTRNALFVLKNLNELKNNLKKITSQIIHIQNLTNLLFTQNQNIRYVNFKTENQEFLHIIKTNDKDMFHYPGITLKNKKKEFERILEKTLMEENFNFLKAYSFLSKRFHIHKNINDMISDAMLMPEAYYELKKGDKKDVNYSKKLLTMIEDVQKFYPYLKITMSDELERKIINTRNNIAHFNINKNGEEFSDIQEEYDYIVFMNVIYSLLIFAHFTPMTQLRCEFFSESYLIKGWTLKSLIEKNKIKGLNLVFFEKRIHHGIKQNASEFEFVDNVLIFNNLPIDFEVTKSGLKLFVADYGKFIYFYRYNHIKDLEKFKNKSILEKKLEVINIIKNDKLIFKTIKELKTSFEI